MTYADRIALTDALHDERNRLEALGRVWDVADVVDIVQAFIDARGGLKKPTKDKKG